MAGVGAQATRIRRALGSWPRTVAAFEWRHELHTNHLDAHLFGSERRVGVELPLYRSARIVDS
jgi:hypothetical protein